MADFKIYQKSGKNLIERLVFPRLIGEITFGLDSDIENIELIDHCTDASLLARVMREAADFLMANSKG